MKEFIVNIRAGLDTWGELTEVIVSLELQLAADIAGTIISPTTAHLIELGTIALIRTFLNYFLNKELLEERELSFKSTQGKKEAA